MCAVAISLAARRVELCRYAEPFRVVLCCAVALSYQRRPNAQATSYPIMPPSRARREYRLRECKLPAPAGAHPGNGGVALAMAAHANSLA